MGSNLFLHLQGVCCSLGLQLRVVSCHPLLTPFSLRGLLRGAVAEGACLLLQQVPALTVGGVMPWNSETCITSNAA